MVARLVEPVLAPIRRIMPFTGGVDFSPLVLILIIQFLGRLILGLMIL
jgi:YggT family protein